MAVSFFPVAGGGDTPAVPPDVNNGTLQSIIDEIYSGTTNPISTGDGKLATALLNEIETGKPTFGQWHAVDLADQLTRLVNLLEADRKPNGNVSLSATDRATALKEADELWKALNKPLSNNSPLYESLVNNPATRQSLAAVERNILNAPSMKSITGIEFEQPHPKAAPRPKTSLGLGRVMGGVGAVAAILDVFLMFRAVFDQNYADAYMCQMWPDSAYCYPDGVPLA